MTISGICVCPDCDLVYKKPLLQHSQMASCTRCGAILCRHQDHLAEKTLAFSLAGLLFYVPANTLPVLTFQILHMDSTNNMLNGVQQLFMGGYWWMSFLVLACSVIVPLLDLLLMFVIALGLKSRMVSRAVLKTAMRWQHHWQEWGMPEVYMLGILVAYIKMVDMGTITVGIGLICFVGMLFSIMLAKSVYDAESAFDLLERS